MSYQASMSLNGNLQLQSTPYFQKTNTGNYIEDTNDIGSILVPVSQMAGLTWGIVYGSGGIYESGGVSPGKEYNSCVQM